MDNNQTDFLIDQRQRPPQAKHLKASENLFDFKFQLVNGVTQVSCNFSFI